MLPVFERAFQHEQSAVTGIAHVLCLLIQINSISHCTSMLCCTLFLSWVWLHLTFAIYERPVLLQVD